MSRFFWAGILAFLSMLPCAGSSSATSKSPIAPSLVYLGRENAISVPNSFYTPYYVQVAYPKVVRDKGRFWDASENHYVVPDTMPPNTYATFRCNVRWQDTGGHRVQVLISKFDGSSGEQLQSAYPEAGPVNQLFTGGTTTDQVTFTHPILLEPGDAYACQVWQSGDSGEDGPIKVLQSGFSLQVHN